MSRDSTLDPDPDAVDYYRFVGVPRDASQDEVDSALTRAKGHYHPDQSALDARTASRCFDRVRDAEAVLAERDSRSAYDTFIERFGPERGHEAFENWQDSGGHVDPEEWDPETAADTGGDESSTAAGTTETGTTRRDQTTAGTGTNTGTAGDSQPEGTADTRRQGTQWAGGRSGTREQGERTGTQWAGGRSETREQGEQTGTRGGNSRGETRGAAGAGTGVNSGRLSAVRRRIVDSRLSVFVPVAVQVDRGLDLVAAPGLYVRTHVDIPAQFGLVAALTLGAFVAVEFAGPAAGLLASVVWLLGSLTLYVAGGALWLCVVGATILAESGQAVSSTAVVGLVTVLGYALLVHGKTQKN